VARTSSGPLQEFTVSYQSLLPSTAYKFRVIAYNKYGISYPAYSDVAVLTPSKLYLEYGYLQVIYFKFFFDFTALQYFNFHKLIDLFWPNGRQSSCSLH
jgi:hypothetical protein